MPKKKKDNKGKKDKKEEVPGPETDPMILFRNYAKQCECVGIEVNDLIKRALCNNEDENSSTQLLIGGGEGDKNTNNDSRKTITEPLLLGPSGTRALVKAILGMCDHDNKTRYTGFKEIRIWRSNLGDHGAIAIALLFREAGPEHKISLVELSDNDIGVQGATALGRTLCAGMMKTLVNLNLDYNSNIGSSGLAGLAKGLISNRTLKRLYLRYCGIDEDGGKHVSAILSAPKVALTIIDITGNRLRGKGLHEMCHGLQVNSSLQQLYLTDNGIMSTESDFDGISQFANVLRDHKSLTEIYLLHNKIGVESALALMGGIENNKLITGFVVDTSLPTDIYTSLNRIPTSGKGKKKKGSKKKKKK